MLAIMQDRSGSLQLLNKVPEVTLIFWIIKTLSTTVGETFADFLNVTLSLGLNITSIVMGVLLVAALAVQIRLSRYVATAYWTCVVLISVVGTLISDNLVDKFHVPLATSSSLFAVILAAAFLAWYAVERTLSVHTIVSRRREFFYWGAILFTFSLGTSFGDLMAEKLALGYALSALMFATFIGLVTAAYYGLRLNAILAFWLAYILTRPLGASMGDLLSQPIHSGGLGFGTSATSAAFLVTIVFFVIHLSGQQARQQRAALVDAEAGE
ncbi:MAG: COG4705 family protein [Acetobacteraceae bacterium]